MPVRPKSIVQFEQVMWGIIALSLIAIAVGWSDATAGVDVQKAIAQVGMAAIYIPIAIGIGLQLLFWYFIARRGSVIVKWIYVVVTVASVAWSALGLARGSAPDMLQGAIAVVLIALQVWAVILLFRPDTKSWFGEDAPAA